jgi:hypothetical protein
MLAGAGYDVTIQVAGSQDGRPVTVTLTVPDLSVDKLRELLDRLEMATRRRWGSRTES